MNWKYLVIIVFSGFVVLIGSLVFAAYKNGQDLVYENYYEKEIQFQDQINKEKNLRSSAIQANITAETDKVIISFTESNNTIKGNIYFYRPSDKSEDRTYAIKLNDKKEQVFENKDFKEGLYKVKVDWEEAGECYYLEKSIYISHAN